MKRAIQPLAFVACAWTLAPAMAVDFDGSKPLICAAVEAIDCASGFECFRGIPDEIGAPAFMRIDFEKKAISGPKRTTAIQLMNKSERQVLLQGSEVGYGWAFALDQGSGKFSASMTDRAGTFVVFGSCTPL